MTPEEVYESMLPTNYVDELDDNLEKHWAFAYGNVPVPMFEVRCPVCNSEKIIQRKWTFHNRKRQGSSRPWRGDVHFKCAGCSYAWVHGVVVPEAVYRAHQRNDLTTKVWRQMRDFVGGNR